jgi:hypothetical protein
MLLYLGAPEFRSDPQVFAADQALCYSLANTSSNLDLISVVASTVDVAVPNLMLMREVFNSLLFLFFQ